MSYSIVSYTPEKQQEWDTFVDTARNGVFLFKRNFMDYHSDRFTDASLMFYEGDRLKAVLPQSLHENGAQWRSHGGLTYGGLVQAPEITVVDVVEIFNTLKTYAQNKGVKEQIYKPLPHIYAKYPSQEDLYALFLQNAGVEFVTLDAVIDLENPLKMSSLRKRGAKKALKNSICVEESENFEEYHAVLAQRLAEGYGVEPVHTAAEMTLLQRRFEEEIKLFVAKNSVDDIIAGVWMFDFGHTVHAQYIAANDGGKENGALDLVFVELIQNIYKDRKYFSFGISNEDGGRKLNVGLSNQKNMFGGRGVVYTGFKVTF